MTILAWIILGLIAGWLASLLMGSGGRGIIGDIVFGILGAVNWTVKWFRPGGRLPARIIGEQIAQILIGGLQSE